MKKKLILLLLSMILLVAVLVIVTIIVKPQKEKTVSKEDTKIQVLTTFYPVYMVGLNLADQVNSIEIKSLTDLNSGCLHDYQLTTEDVKSIANADVLVINGGGMESFLEDVIKNYPDLVVIDASENITMLPNVVWELGKEEEEDIQYNSHVWLDPVLYIKQIENVRDGLINYIGNMDGDLSEDTLAIKKNAETYINKVQELNTEIEKNFIDVVNQIEKDKQVIIFHNSFEYLANRIGLSVRYTVPLDSDTALSAGDIAKIIDAVNTDRIHYLFTEEQYGDSIADRIEEETDAVVYMIDSVVTGDGAKDSYLTAMQKNLQVLKEAFQ